MNSPQTERTAFVVVADVDRDTGVLDVHNALEAAGIDAPIIEKAHR